MNFFFHVGRYFSFLARVFSKPERLKVFFRKTFQEIGNLGVNSVGLVIIMSIFMGAIITLQMAYNLTSPFLPVFLIGLGNRELLILEFSSTILSLLLAGKIGSNITSEIGSMRVTEQIDSLEIMGINSAEYLIFPKIIAVIFIFPFLYILSVFFGLVGGLVIGTSFGAISPTDYINGLQHAFTPYYISFSIIKMLFYAFLISTIPSYYGYYVKGGAFDVGKASMSAVVNTDIMILIFDLILTQLLFK